MGVARKYKGNTDWREDNVIQMGMLNAMYLRILSRLEIEICIYESEIQRECLISSI